jgi:hypothetical protein
MRPIRLLAVLAAVSLVIFCAGQLFGATKAGASPVTVDPPSAALPKVVAPQARTHQPAGYTISVSPTIAAPSGTQTTGTVACPSGTVVWGGGVFTDSFADLTVNSSFPTGDTGWEGSVSNPGPSSYAFKAVAICADEPADYSIQASGPIEVPGVTETSASEACPKHTVVLSGGGYSSSGDAPDVSLHSSFPTVGTKKVNYWNVTENNADPIDSYLYAYAVCAKKPMGYKQVAGGVEDDSAGLTVGTGAACAKGGTIGGGVLAVSADLDVDVAAIYPEALLDSSDTGFEFSESNYSTEQDGGNVQAYAECAT